MSDEFDTILDRCLTDLVSGRETLESCLRRYPTHAGHLQTLLSLAAKVWSAPGPAPLPLDKRRALESRLLRQAGKMRPAGERPAVPRSSASHRPFWQRGAVLVALSLIVCVLLLTSTVSASASSLPGDALYPIKRAAEQVRVALTPMTSQAALHLELAQARLQELNALAQRGDVSTDSLADLGTEMDAVLQQVAQLPVQQQSALLMRIDAFQNEQARALTFVASLAHGEKQGRAQAALSAFVAKREVLKGLMLKASIPVDTEAPDKGKDPQPTNAQNEKHPSQGGGPQGNEATSMSTLKPTATDRPTATDKPAAVDKPTATDKPKATKPAVDAKPTKQPGPQATPRATKPPPSSSNKPTPQAKDHTPGSGNSNSGSPPVHATKAPKTK